jgi:tRNA modification GTPase
MLSSVLTFLRRPYAGLSHQAIRPYTALPITDAQRETIFALSTPRGKAGVAVIRISGPDALSAWKSLVKRRLDHFVSPEPWKMQRCKIIHPENGEALDDGLAVYFKGTQCS